MSILVTGSTGFIGKNLVADLIKNNYKVVAALRKQPANQELIHWKWNNNNLLTIYQNFQLDNKQSIQNLFKEHSDIQIIIHLASVMDFYPSSKESISNMYLINVEGTKMLYKEFLQNKNCKIFIQASTQEAMGPNSDLNLLANEKSPCNPTFEYGKSKLMAENQLKELFEEFKLENKEDKKHTFILRLTGVCGKGDRYAAFELIQATALGINSLAYAGDCKKGTVSFVHVKDVIQAFYKCMERSKNLKDNFIDTFIIGPKTVLSCKQAVDILCDKLYWNRPLFTIPLPIFLILISPFSPIVNLFRRTLFGYNRNSFLFEKETFNCMEENHGYTSEKAMKELGYDPLTMKEALEKSVEEHFGENALPKPFTVKLILTTVMGISLILLIGKLLK
ncbi:hypothetical protein ABK040_012154 [Willaertia magna]